MPFDVCVERSCRRIKLFRGRKKESRPYGRFLCMTHVSENWNQLVQELYHWQEFGKLLEREKALVS